MAISGSATTPAAKSAVISNDLVNVPSGTPAQERWQGAVDPEQYNDAGPAFPVEGPPSGSWMADDFGSTTPASLAGGGLMETSWMTGTDAPMAPWDSSAGEPFAPSGALDPELHGQDTGAVHQKSYVVPAAIGQLKRHTGVGQAMDRTVVYDPATGQYIPAPAGRSNMDQQQWHDPNPVNGGGYAPAQPGYAERPVYNNLAYEATPVTATGTVYGVSGELPNRAPLQYAASTYESPADPVVNAPAPMPSDSSGGGWLIG